METWGWMSCSSTATQLYSNAPSAMQELFKEKHYSDLDGGILEGFGRLLKYDLKLYVYPTLDAKTGELVTAETLQVGLLPHHAIS